MRGVRQTAMAVRKPDGAINLEIWDNSSIKDRYIALKLPFIRGVVNFVEMLVLGYRCIMSSAETAGLEENHEDCEEPPTEKESKGPGIGIRVAEAASILIGIVIAIVLFSVAPAYLTNLTGSFISFGPFKTLIEGLIRIAIFVLYLFAISRMKDMKRIFSYHGAEHKTIYCYEHGEELTIQNARKYTRLHPRCGTSFLLIVLVISILVYSLLQVTWDVIWLRIIIKIALLPVIVGISYEIIRFAGRHDNSAMRFILAPGLWMQKLTTREPDDSQLEVAITSIKAVLTGNPTDDSW